MPSKRSHGEGTLRHRSDGRWELRMMDGYQRDGSPRFKTFYGKTQKEVKLKLKEYQDALISGVRLDTILYFEDWADTWFEGHKDNIAPTTQESYKYCLKILKEGFYHRPLTVIRPIDIENFLKGMRRDGRSDSYISKARGMLYQIFQKAEANDLVRRNPVRLAEKMRASGTAKRKEAFTTAEVAHLMKVLPDDRMGLSIRLLLGTGMRMQELLALEPQFIEEDGSVIHIRQAVKVVKGTVSIGSPKSKDSIRDIPVPLNVRPCAIKLCLLLLHLTLHSLCLLHQIIHITRHSSWKTTSFSHYISSSLSSTSISMPTSSLRSTNLLWKSSSSLSLVTLIETLTPVLSSMTFSMLSITSCLLSEL